MCTVIYEKETEKYKAKLKKLNYAWKIVEVTETGEYVPPFRHNFWGGKSLAYKKNRTNKVRLIPTNKSGPWALYGLPDLKIWTAGVFHCCITRRGARELLKKSDPLIHRGNKYKIVKVVFNKKDFVCVGKLHPYDIEAWGLTDEISSVCVKKFKFV